MVKELPLFFEDESWIDEAECASLPARQFNRLFMGEGVDSFEPDQVVSRRVNAEAKTVCGGCTAKLKCLEKAISTGDINMGVRGEMTPFQIERELIRRAREAGGTRRRPVKSAAGVRVTKKG